MLAARLVLRWYLHMYRSAHVCALYDLVKSEFTSHTEVVCTATVSITNFTQTMRPTKRESHARLSNPSDYARCTLLVDEHLLCTRVLTGR